MKLNKAERFLIGQIVNIKMGSASLRDHIRLEKIFKAADPDSIILSTPEDFVPADKKELFAKYDGKDLKEIEDKDDQAVLRDAILKTNEERAKVWNDESEGDFEAKFSTEDIIILKDFYEKDQRTFPKQYHAAILTLSNKLEKAMLKSAK